MQMHIMAKLLAVRQTLFVVQ